MTRLAAPARLVAVLGVAALAVTGCAPDGGGGLDTGPARRDVAAPASPSGPTTGSSAAGAPDAGLTAAGRTAAGGSTVPPPALPPGRTPPWATVATGRFAADPAVEAFARYAPARTQALVRRQPRLPALVATTTPQRLAQDAGWVAKLRRERRSVPRTARWVVTGVRRGEDTATVTACVWEPSIGIVDARGRPEDGVDRRWQARTVGLVRLEGRWRVASDATSDTRCEEVA